MPVMRRVNHIFASLLLFACATNEKITKTHMSMSMDWIKQTNVYEVNLRQYTEEGTFNAFVKELPRLKDMGVETLWFMPITPIAQKK